nr:UDP-N-acetylenolpyruvoylglucosamine reductase [Capnocytophaga canimorsus]
MKKVFDEIEEVDYFRAVISDSKLNADSPWTANQKSELIDVFKNNPDKKYIEFEVRTNNKFLKEANAPKDFEQDIKIRIYREDVYKIISEGENIKIPPIKMSDINFKNQI